MLQKINFLLKSKVVVLLLSGQFNLYMFILGKPGTCEKIGKFQCKNGKCISKGYICDSDDDCGDRSDESKTDGAFCGMLLFFCGLNRNLLSNLLGSNKLCQNKREFLKSGFGQHFKEI